MNKIFLVASREFLTRVQKKTFLLTTIMLPVIIFGFYAMMIYFSVQSDSSVLVAVADKADLFKGEIGKNDNEIKFIFVQNETEASLRQKLMENKYNGYVMVPEGTSIMNIEKLKVITNKAIGLMTQEKIERQLNNALENKRLLSLNITKTKLDSIQHKGDIEFKSIEGSEEKQNVAGIAYGVGMISGFLIYFVLFVYGTMVMRGVMEEKTSRIAEVIVSSVKPFQLMLGKIFGIGSVGLLQFIIWGILVIALQMLLPFIFPGAAEQMAAHQGAIQPAGMQAVQSAKPGIVNELMQGLDQINIGLIFVCFVFYFLGGYLLYSSLFAAVGCTVNEDPQDAQSLMLPITFPIIFAIVLMTKAVNAPNSSLALFGSLFPLTSPIVMMGRLPYGVPAWQLAASFALLIGGFIGTAWIAAKIYRTGILMYGKKVTWKEMMKWAFRKS